MKELYLDGNLFAGTEEEYLAVEKFHSKLWKFCGETYRDNDLFIIYSNGYQVWYRDKKTHRSDGPAAIWPSGTKYWYQNGECLTWINDWLPLSYWICGE